MRPRAHDRGFVLIGVVMFVLALTILSLSLYGLSSYESQFLGQTHDQNVALDEAESGMAMACQLLAQPPYHLSGSTAVVGLDHVTRAVAWQDVAGGGVDSMGTVNTDTTVTVLVSADVNGSERTIQARFRPKEQNQYYKHLFTSTDPIVVYPKSYPDGGSSRVGTVALSGPVWQFAADTSQWADPSNPAQATWAGPHPVLHDPIGVLDIADFFQQHNGATNRAVAGSPPSLNLEGPDGSETYYTATTAEQQAFHQWSLYSSAGSFRIDVQGTAVLLLPFGARFEGGLEVVGHGLHPVLVIVTAPNPLGDPDFPLASFWLFGGMDAHKLVGATPDYAHMPVVLATAGQALFEQHNNSTTNSYAEALSVWASEVLMTGPKPGSQFSLDYDPLVMDPVIDELLSDGDLPQPPSSGTPQGYTLIPGSWQDLTP